MKNGSSIDFKVISFSSDFTLIFGVFYTAKFQVLTKKKKIKKNLTYCPKILVKSKEKKVSKKKKKKKKESNCGTSPSLPVFRISNKDY